MSSFPGSRRSIAALEIVAFWRAGARQIIFIIEPTQAAEPAARMDTNFLVDQAWRVRTEPGWAVAGVFFAWRVWLQILKIAATWRKKMPGILLHL
jgi:hypothetical protein